MQEGSIAKRVQQAGANAPNLVVTNQKAPKNGYCYLYVSNESDEMLYFDNLQVTQNHARIIEENHYYAYGLKIAGISSRKLPDPNEGQLKNNHLYQGSFSEFDDDIGWNDFALRSYDPQIGRWIQVDPYDEFPSPYTGMGNDPINNLDPSGGGIFDGLGAIAKIGVKTFLGAVVGTAIDINSGGDGTKGFAIGAGVGLLGGIAGNFGIRVIAGGVTKAVGMATNPYASYAGNSSPNWASKGPFKVHQEANNNGIFNHSQNPNLNLKATEKLKILNKATVDMDKDQSGGGSYKHAMRNRNLDPDKAKIKADNFVKEKLGKAKDLLKNGKFRDAYYQFGLALHTLQDATSPAHNGFQEWNGDETKQQQIAHVQQELFYPGIKSNLQWITNLMLDWFESSFDTLPNSNFFDVIFPDHL